MKRTYLYVFAGIIIIVLLVALFLSQKMEQPDLPEQSSIQGSEKLQSGANIEQQNNEVDEEIISESTENLDGAEKNNNDAEKPGTGSSQEVVSKKSGSENFTAQSEEKKKGISLKIAVVGKEKRLLFGPAEVIVKENNLWGATALGALDAAGLSYEMSPKFPDLVIAVAGQRNQGQSGWMYKVNDQSPLVAASKKVVKEGDRVIWWYSTSINDPPPEWSGLKN